MKTRIRHVAKVVLYDRDGMLVMQKRDNGAEAKNKGRLSFFGGGVEAGETNRIAALRELREETNVMAREDDLKHIYSKFVWDKNELIRVHYYQIDFPIATETLEVYEGSGFALKDPRKLRLNGMSPLVQRVVWRMRLKSRKK